MTTVEFPIYDNEYLLDNDYPVHCGYFYLIEGVPTRSVLQGTAEDLKRRHKTDDVRRCDLAARNMLNEVV